ncbi:MAG: hypothetical protein ACXWZV_08540 [Solirubrobacterales bacterium]
MTSDKASLSGPRQRMRGAAARAGERLGPARDRLATGVRRLGEGLRPLGAALRPLGAALSAIAPYVAGALWAALRVPLALLAALVDLLTAIGERVRMHAGTVAAVVGHHVTAAVTPVRTLAAVCAAAALALGASQFADYAGVAVGAPGYAGEVGAVAPAPQTALEPAGSAHLYVLLPLAGLALALVWLTACGRWRLGRAVAAVGLAGLVVTLAIDLPQGLDTGRAGSDYLGTEARLVEGFWSQLAASAALLALGPLLGAYARRAGDGFEPAPRSPAGRRRRLARRRASARPPRERAAIVRAGARP